MKTENFEIFKKFQFSLIDDEVRVFRINKTLIQSGRRTKNPRKRFTLPVHSLKNYGPLNSTPYIQPAIWTTDAIGNSDHIYVTRNDR
jgi:hypothetical protein